MTGKNSPRAHHIPGKNGTFLEPDKAIETHPADDATTPR
jgi:hypothetical protein